MLELYLIRHGQTQWNVERRVMGLQPIGLNDTGKDQIQSLASALQHLSIDHIYTSPLQRTLESALILNQKREIEIQSHPSLREIEYGVWVGKTFDEIRAQKDYVDPYTYPQLPLCEQAESLNQVRDRAVSFIEELRQKEKDKKIMLVSHADWIKAVVLHYLDLPLSQIRQLRIDNASLTYLTFDSQLARVICVNHNASFLDLFVPRHAF